MDIARSGCGPGDKVTVREPRKNKKMVSEAIEVNKSQVVPNWLSVSGRGHHHQSRGIPRREHVPHPIQEQLIIELCSK